MDDFELKPQHKKINTRVLILNLLTVLVLIGVCCLVYYFVTLFLNPNSSLNPFPPQALPTLYETPTSTATIIPQPATWTPTETIEPSPTRSKVPTWTPLPELVTPSITATFTETSEPSITGTAMPAAVEISHVASTTIHSDLACNWMGLGGKVLNSDGTPLLFQTLQMGGTLENKPVSRITTSGSSTAYGPSGFEFALDDHPISSSQTMWIQLFDNAGKPLTQKIYFDTYASCGENLVLFTFTKTR